MQMQKDRSNLVQIGSIFEHKLNVSYILANDFGKFYCVNN